MANFNKQFPNWKVNNIIESWHFSRAWEEVAVEGKINDAEYLLMSFFCHQFWQKLYVWVFMYVRTYQIMFYLGEVSF